jgi:hypothetical protein
MIEYNQKEMEIISKADEVNMARPSMGSLFLQNYEKFCFTEVVKRKLGSKNIF